jgi:hypothetical protein
MDFSPNNRREIATRVFGIALAILLIFTGGMDGWAEVEASQEGRGQNAPIQVAITTHLGDGQRFVEGDTIAFFLSLDTDAHILAVYENAERQRIQILPNRDQGTSHYPSGIFHPIPGEGAAFQFRVAAPFGREKLWVFAAKQPFQPFSGQPLDNGLKLLSAELATIRAELKAQAGAAYGEACLEILTQPESGD